jgi:predicted DsbA family dithiol-disulfide isomerase
MHRQVSAGSLRPLVLLVLFSACNANRSERAAAVPAKAGGNPKAVVAKIDGEVITASDLDAKAKAGLARLEAEHAEKGHELRSETLNQLVEERLLDKKAKAQGLSREKLLEREVTAKIAEPSAAEMQQVYDASKARGQNLPPFDQVKDQIVSFLKERKTGEARKAYLDKLRAEHKVELTLPPLLLPKVEVAAVGPSRGDPKAPITIVEFSDFECPFCVRAEESIKKVLEAYPGKVRVVYRDYPLPFHPRAQKASEAALCAQDQGKYWQMHEKLFANQKALEPAQLKQHAKDLGLEAGKFDKCLDSGEKAALVDASKKAGEEAGVSGTPAFFINGRPLSGAQPFEKFKEIIDAELGAGGS